MTQGTSGSGIDLGIERQRQFDERGIPEPPSWMTEMIEAKTLTLTFFDGAYEMAIKTSDKGACIFLRNAKDAVTFFLGPVSLDLLQQMTKSLLPRAALADAKPLDTQVPDLFLGHALGDFQVFTYVRMEAGAVLYARAVDTRCGIRLILATDEAVARFAVSLRAAHEACSRPKFEKLDIPYTTISSKNPVESPEQFREAVRMTRSAKGGKAAPSYVGDAFGGLIPDSLLAKYDRDGLPVAPSRSPSAVLWAIGGATAAFVTFFLAYRFLFSP